MCRLKAPRSGVVAAKRVWLLRVEGGFTCASDGSIGEIVGDFLDFSGQNMVIFLLDV